MAVRSLRYNTFEGRNWKGATFATDADALAFLEAAQVYDRNQQKAIVDLVRRLKSAGLWTKMKAIYPFVGGTASSHKWNLKDPRDADAAFRLTFNGGWTHSTTGALPNGTNTYANTFWDTENNGSATNGHYSFYSRTNNAQNSVDIGSAQDSGGGGDSYSYLLQFTASIFVRDSRWCESTLSNTRKTNPTRTDGFIVASRTAINLAKQYYNGSIEVTNNVTESGRASARDFYISAYCINGGAPISYSSRECAFATIGDGLTDTDVTNLYNIVDLYQKRLGRAV